jgi:hypothetical protein
MIDPNKKYGLTFADRLVYAAAFAVCLDRARRAGYDGPEDLDDPGYRRWRADTAAEASLAAMMAVAAIDDARAGLLRELPEAMLEAKRAPQGGHLPMVMYNALALDAFREVDAEGAAVDVEPNAGAQPVAEEQDCGRILWQGTEAEVGPVQGALIQHAEREMDDRIPIELIEEGPGRRVGAKIMATCATCADLTCRLREAMLTLARDLNASLKKGGDA